jgi:hypothetical protein
VRSARRRGILNSFDVGGVFAMELVTPSSIAFSGTSASIVGSGSVDFSAVTSLSLNGVFSADYDNYYIVVRHFSNSNQGILYRLRLGSTDASGSNYTYQEIQASGTTVSGVRTSSSTSSLFAAGISTNRGGTLLSLYGPFLSQPTASRSVNGDAANGGRIIDLATTHSLSTSYDGITIFLSTANITGNVAVYGLRG